MNTTESTPPKWIQIQAIAVNPSGHVFAGTSSGGLLYRSLDGGETWQNMGLRGTRFIHRIAIHPENTDVVFVAATDQAYSALMFYLVVYVFMNLGAFGVIVALAALESARSGRRVQLGEPRP